MLADLTSALEAWHTWNVKGRLYIALNPVPVFVTTLLVAGSTVSASKKLIVSWINQANPVEGSLVPPPGLTGVNVLSKVLPSSLIVASVVRYPELN